MPKPKGRKTSGGAPTAKPVKRTHEEMEDREEMEDDMNDDTTEETITKPEAKKGGRFSPASNPDWLNLLSFCCYTEALIAYWSLTANSANGSHMQPAAFIKKLEDCGIKQYEEYRDKDRLADDKLPGRFGEVNKKMNEIVKQHNVKGNVAHEPNKEEVSNRMKDVYKNPANTVFGELAKELALSSDVSISDSSLTGAYDKYSEIVCSNISNWWASVGEGTKKIGKWGAITTLVGAGAATIWHFLPSGITTLIKKKLGLGG